MKRIFDLFVSLFCLIILSPFLLVVSVIVKKSSPGPVLYKGTRTGLNGVPFKILKFRTMVHNAESVGGPSTALNDPRLTRSGKILRRFKIDELPQLINILQGDMSLVGPRPQVQQYTDLYTDEEKKILSVRPGLTDFSSVYFINLDEILGDGDVDEKYLREVEPKKNKLRLKYVREQSMWTDIKIIFMTASNMLGIKFHWNIDS